jgi:putative ABC transport system substrate-binding protein
MQRREVITLFGGAVAAWPLAARAQQAKKVYRVGFLWDGPDVFPDALEAFRQGLRDFGYVEGQTIAIEYRWRMASQNGCANLRRKEELVGLKVDVIITPSSRAAKRASSTIPIIFLSHADPLGTHRPRGKSRTAGRQRHRAARSWSFRPRFSSRAQSRSRTSL